jgi:phage tail sheath protein FI
LRLNYPVSTQEQAKLNPLGVNCIRNFPEGILVWGGRTLAAGDSDMRYLNIRRLLIMIEGSIVQSTRWVVFEPNDMSLWKSIRRDVSAFLRLLWRDGALMGATPEQAFFVKCDEETNPPEVIDAGQVVILIGIAPVKPAEFVIFRIGQTAAGAQTESL